MIIDVLFFLGEESILSFFADYWPNYQHGQQIYLKVVKDGRTSLQHYTILEIVHTLEQKSNAFFYVENSARMEVYLAE